MARKLKLYQGWDIANHADESLTRDGRHATQVSCRVLATSQRAAADAVGITMSHFRDYWGDGDDDPTTVAEYSYHPPGTVFIGPLNGGTVNGQTGYVVRRNFKEIAERRQRDLAASREQNAKRDAYREERVAREERAAETLRRSQELLAEMQPLLEQLGIHPDTVQLHRTGGVMLPPETLLEVLRAAVERDELVML